MSPDQPEPEHTPRPFPEDCRGGQGLCASLSVTASTFHAVPNRGNGYWDLGTAHQSGYRDLHGSCR